MKRKIFSVLAAFSALVLASCQAFGSNESDENNTEGKAAYITVDLNGNARTALPSVSGAEEFTSITLTGTSTTENAVAVPETSWSTDSTSSAYAKMHASKLTVTVGASYSFTLKAIKGGAEWQGTTSKTIEAGANSLSFTLALKSLSAEGMGAIRITLIVPDVVKAVAVKLENLEESGSEDPAELEPEGAELTFANGKATYTAENIPAGSYVLVFGLWADAEKRIALSEWREFIGVTEGNTSVSNPVIESADKLQTVYQITFNSNGGSAVPSQIVKPRRHADKPANPTKDGTDTYGYAFVNWYTSTDDGATLSAEPFNFDSEITGNITLYAKWDEGPIFRVTFNANAADAVISTSSQDIFTNTDTALASIEALGLTRTDYMFCGWNTAADGSGTPYTDRAVINRTSNITLYAQWGMPLTLEVTEDCSETQYCEVAIIYPWSTFKYRRNGGELTDYYTSSNGDYHYIHLYKGDKISLFAQASENYNRQSNERMRIRASEDCYIYGNIMSLVTLDPETGAWDKDSKELVGSYTFANLFSRSTGNNIKSHDTKKLLLPATTLTEGCYSNMFWGTKITVAPELPATTLAPSCYNGMFYECSNLTEAPELLATTLADSCYKNMFSDCSNLTEAPVLPATTLVDYCYYSMFYSCRNLTYIKCLATDLSANDCTTYWVSRVNSSGRFVKAKDADWSSKSESDGIPSGWTIEEAEQ